MELPTIFPGQNQSVYAHTLTQLTAREWAVLLEVANDSSNATIAERLCITTKSVENYRTRIGGKMELTGHRVLERFARQHKPALRQWYELLVGELPSTP
ncbi:response regulator transcription factor [Fibrella sp. HMF5335]|uniref:Response regulator transcription factor n=1 Tax=Fibrella rubiginis TaxID=2817060 RepID=A0A939GMG7_9BACT|nr:LuxR C-terminal-related transcriptional regulator [Fibrella rubiginis]MBO0940079.1 response regulator transcription factor [Fibrella rubiginis]